MMSQGIESLTVPTLSAALDAAAMRQQAIAANIANANTPGYVPVHMRFEAVMAQASQTGTGSLADHASLTLQPALISASGGVSGGAVHLDQEVAAMSQNTAHYQALLKGLNRYFSLLSTAISEGRR